MYNVYALMNMNGLVPLTDGGPLATDICIHVTCMFTASYVAMVWYLVRISMITHTLYIMRKCSTLHFMQQE